MKQIIRTLGLYLTIVGVLFGAWEVGDRGGARAQFNGCQAGFCNPHAAPAASLLLDTLSATSIAAFSSRQLRGAYAGNPMHVTSTGGGGADIGFSGGDLNKTALHTLVGVNTGGVDTWYDQSTRGTNGTESRTAHQPSVVISGTDQTLGSGAHIALNYVAANGDDETFFSTQTQPLTIAIAFKINSSPNFGGLTGSLGANVSVALTTGPVYQLIGGGTTRSGGTPDTTNTHTLIAIFDDAGTGSSIVLDGTVIIGPTTVGTNGFDGMGQIIGLDANFDQIDAFIPEYLAFSSHISTSDQGKIRTSWQSYWGAL